MKMQLDDMLKKLSIDVGSKENAFGLAVSRMELDDATATIDAMRTGKNKPKNYREYFQILIEEIEKGDDLALLFFVESTVQMFGERSNLRVSIGQVLDSIGIKDSRVLVNIQNAITESAKDIRFLRYLGSQAPNMATSVINASVDIRKSLYEWSSHIAIETPAGTDIEEGFGNFMQSIRGSENVFNAVIANVHPALFESMPLDTFSKESLKAMFKNIASDSAYVDINAIREKFGDLINNPQTKLDIANAIIEVAQSQDSRIDKDKLKSFYDEFVLSDAGRAVNDQMQGLVDACLKHPVRVASLRDQELTVSQQAKAVSMIGFDQMIELCKGIQLNPVAKAIVRVVQFVTGYDFSKEMSEVAETAKGFMSFVGVTPQQQQEQEKPRAPQTAMEKVVAKFFKASTFAEKAAAKGQEQSGPAKH